MELTKTLRSAGAAIAVLGFSAFAAPAMADDGQADRLGPISVMSQDELANWRAGQDTIVNSFNTTVTGAATNNVNASIGTMNVTVGGNILGGDVILSDNALSAFNGLATQAFATAPGVIATATTSINLMLLP